jgi:hypothetical protein
LANNNSSFWTKGVEGLFGGQTNLDTGSMAGIVE